MNSDALFNLIERIAATPRKNEKIAILKEKGSDLHLQKLLRYTLDPGRTYGLAARPEPIAPNPGPFSDPGLTVFGQATWDMLDALADRRLTGHQARQQVAEALGRLSEGSAELLWRVISTDLRAGFSESTVNKAIPGLIEDPPYMRCSLPKASNLSKFDWNRGAYSQKKANGMFANVQVRQDGSVSLSARSGHVFPSDPFGHLIDAAGAVLDRGYGYHGELLVVEHGRILPRQIGNGILTSVAKGGDFGPGQAPLFEAWDRVPLADLKPKGSHLEPYSKRFEALRSKMGEGHRFIRLIDTRIVYSLQEAVAHCVEVMREGEEGTIIKSPDLIWRDGTSKDAVKLKVEAECDLQITAIVPGRAGTKVEGRPGSLTCQTRCGQLITDVNIKNEAMRNAVEADPQAFIGRIVTVLFNEVLSPSPSNPLHSLFLPRLAEDTCRIDKHTADDLACVFEQYEEAQTMQALVAG